MFVCGEFAIEIPCYRQNLLAHNSAVFSASMIQPASEHPVILKPTTQEESRDPRG